MAFFDLCVYFTTAGNDCQEEKSAVSRLLEATALILPAVPGGTAGRYDETGPPAAIYAGWGSRARFDPRDLYAFLSFADVKGSRDPRAEKRRRIGPFFILAAAPFIQPDIASPLFPNGDPP